MARPLAPLFRKPPPDPWPAEIDAEVRAGGAVPLCLHCLSPQVERRYLCPQCGRAVGEYVAWMPYLQNYFLGDLLQCGVTGPPERGLGAKLFLGIVAMCNYPIFAPFYWYRMYRKARSQPICRPPIEESTHAL